MSASVEGGPDREITAPLDLGSLREAWALREAKRPHAHVRLTMGARTDLGRVRENNEDKFDFLEPEDPTLLATRGRFYAVADGMGGHAAGQIASEMVLKAVIHRYYADTTSELETALVSAIRYANALVRDTAAAIPGRSGMGATLTAAVVHEDRLVVAQVGDSRLYLIRGGEIRQVTQDHSWVAEQVRMGALDPEAAARSPFRNVITRSIGAEADVQVDLFNEPLQTGDLVLLCSDGLTNEVPDEVIARAATEHPPSVACLTLVDQANEAGGRDNITVMILRVDAVEPYPQAVAAQQPQEETSQETEAPDRPVGEEGLERVEAKRRGLFGLFGRR